MPAQDTEAAYIMLTSEEDGTHLVKAKVHMDGAYQRQQGACGAQRASVTCCCRCPRPPSLPGCCARAHAARASVLGHAARCCWPFTLAYCRVCGADTILSWNEPETGLDYALSFQEPDGCTEVWEQICAVQGRSSDDGPLEQNEQLAAQGTVDGGVGAPSAEQISLPACELRNLGAIPELLSEVDACVEIPQAGLVRSLNVHVSASVALYEFARQHPI